MRRNFRAANYWRGWPSRRSPKNTRKKRCTRREPATKRVLISGEKDNRESRRFGCAFGQPQTKYYYSSTRFTVADRDFTFCLPLRSYFDLAEGSHILLINSYLCRSSFWLSKIITKQRSQLNRYTDTKEFLKFFFDLILWWSLTIEKYFKIILKWKISSLIAIYLIKVSLYLVISSVQFSLIYCTVYFLAFMTVTIQFLASAIHSRKQIDIELKTLVHTWIRNILYWIN